MTEQPDSVVQRALRLRISILAFLLFSLGAIFPAQADLVNADWQVRGDKLLTRDTETGLEWLNIKQTYRRTKADVSQLFGVGQEFEGFRFATVNEYRTLLKHAGIPLSLDNADPNGSFFAGTTENAEPVLTLMDLIGYAAFLFRNGGPDDDHRRLHGILENGFSPILETFRPVDAVGASAGALHARLSASVLNDYRVGSDVGMFLVKQAIVSAVPKPTPQLAWAAGSQ